MHHTALLSAAALLLSTVAAAPYKRDIETETVTQVDTVIEMVTATVWVDPTDAPDSHAAYHSALAEPTTHAVVYHPHSHVHAAPSSTSQAPLPPPPAPTTTSTTAAPPPPTTEAPAPAPPTTTSVYVAPAPTSVYVPPPPPPAPVPTTTSTTPPPAPAPTTTAQAAPTSGGGSSGGQKYSGDITYYTVGLGSCGNTNTDSEFVVAMSAALMNKATMCGKSITLSYGGVTQTATVVDTCPGCASGSLDLSPALFKAIAPNGDGRVKDVQWWFN